MNEQLTGTFVWPPLCVARIVNDLKRCATNRFSNVRLPDPRNNRIRVSIKVSQTRFEFGFQLG